MRRLISIVEGWPSGLRRPAWSGILPKGDVGSATAPKAGEAEGAKPCTAWCTGRSERAHPTPFVVDEKRIVEELKG